MAKVPVKPACGAYWAFKQKGIKKEKKIIIRNMLQS
jgi:hypothetical protein